MSRRSFCAARTLHGDRGAGAGAAAIGVTADDVKLHEVGGTAVPSAFQRRFDDIALANELSSSKRFRRLAGPSIRGMFLMLQTLNQRHARRVSTSGERDNRDSGRWRNEGAR
jgi:hypothetical protein